MIAPAHSQPPRRIQMVSVHSIPEQESDDPSSTKLDVVRCSVAKYPAASLVAAGAVGIALGWLVKRRP
ncbi:hypothetical protein [Rhodopirellula halodulae]|uniref:hypothetical protein n=1 Tax=Rhodopirellula halodulae TaxID=2894198 RepID=UPI001E48A883|nr:hypothetical protein [Rhodopirellula sp. JC737]MCC9658352.1 hypothetical protein [Rhodopirellula sp. JC737]